MTRHVKHLAAILFALAFVLSSSCAYAAKTRVLIYTHNGVGYVHANIAASVDALTGIAKSHGFDVDVSDDPATFTPAKLKQYAVLIFANTNNQAFANEQQRDAFRQYIHAGGGFIGLHSAAGSERDWPYFASVLGARFVEHPKHQEFKVYVADPKASITAGLPPSFVRNDECYFFDSLAPDDHVLLYAQKPELQYLDKMKLKLETYPERLPLAWTHNFDGGREFYLALGHDAEDYKDPVLVGLLERGLLWAAGKTKAHK